MPAQLCRCQSPAKLRAKLIGVIIAFVGLIFGAIQLWQMNTQIINNAAAQLIANSNAIDQLRALREQTEAMTRAQVGMQATGFDYRKDDSGIDRAFGSVIFTNTGVSPALGARMWHCSQVRSSEPGISRIGKEFCRDSQMGTIGKDIPFSVSTIDGSRIVPANSLAKYAYDKGLHFYVWGKITYKIDNHGPNHTTTFCLFNAGRQLTPCREGNDAS